MPEDEETERSNFSSMLARLYLQKEMTKPLFGKPFVKYGQLIGICGYLFQVGGTLGPAFRSTAVPFLRAYSGKPGLGESAAKLVMETLGPQVIGRIQGATTIHEYVCTSQMARVNYTGTWADFFLEHGAERADLETAYTIANWYSLEGAAVGMSDPDKFVALYNSTHRREHPAEWKRAYDAGLNIGPEQDIIPYDEFEQGMLAMFTQYCREFYPELLAALGLAT